MNYSGFNNENLYVFLSADYRVTTNGIKVSDRLGNFKASGTTRTLDAGNPRSLLGTQADVIFVKDAWLALGDRYRVSFSSGTYTVTNIQSTGYGEGWSTISYLDSPATIYVYFSPQSMPSSFHMKHSIQDTLF